MEYKWEFRYHCRWMSDHYQSTDRSRAGDEVTMDRCGGMMAPGGPRGGQDPLRVLQSHVDELSKLLPVSMSGTQRLVMLLQTLLQSRLQKRGKRL
jgi:hypothetical protein